MKPFKKLLVFFGILLLVLVLGYLLRAPILRGVGNFLVSEDEINRVDAIFMLSGGPSERAQEAAAIYKRGHTPIVITTGSGERDALKIMGISMTDAELGKNALVQLGVPDSLVRTLKQGTSTFEEAEQILGYAQQVGYTRIGIVTSKFHTRRTRWTFRKRFQGSGIDVFTVGAPPETYNLSRWWEYEESLIFVNNEYVKLLYYFWAY